MARIGACLGLIIVLSSIVLGQSTDKRPAFDVADVHVSTPSAFAQMSGGVIRAGRYEIRNATMVDLIRTAYGVEAEKVVGGPSWLETDRFDVIATAPGATTAETAKLMLQSLLADRFKLTTHDDSKPLPVYVLTVGKNGSKLKPSSGNANACQPQPQGPPTPGVIPYQVVACSGLTSEQIGENLRRMAGGYVDGPVVDQAKLQGTWDFELKWTARQALQTAGADGISLWDAVDKQLGLHLELQKLPAPVIVVDNVNQKPTDNLPGVGSDTKDAAVEFEAAEIKPTDPSLPPGIGIRYTQGGRIDAVGSLRDLVGIAYEVLPNLAADTVVAPKFAETTRYNILAKVPSSGIGAPDRQGGREVAPPIGVALAMLRKLLEDRFSLKTHSDTRQGTGYALTVKGESKLKKADPTERAGCRPDPNAAPPNPSGTPLNTISCKNSTMAELARNLAQLAPAYIDHPVVDMTGLQGGWDFVLSWTPRGALQQTNAPDANTGPGGVAAAATPSGVTAFEALEKLGLKLEKQTLPILVLVVDHVDEKPKD